jgi:superfamily I DNA/RNA helicase
VTGGAGTGKTVTAIHRARHLANRLDRTGSTAKVLFTTFTKNLAQNIEGQLRELAGADITNRVDVRNIDALVQQVLTSANPDGQRPRLCGDSELDADWTAALAQAKELWDIPFLRAEWTDVVLAQGIEDRGEYLRAARTGRGRRLSRPQRAELWGVFERFTQLLNAKNVMTFTQAAARAAVFAGHLDTAESLTDSGRRVVLPNYRHAVVDEAQDLHPAHWRFLKALVPSGDDNLFIVGDANQRIYGRPIVLSRYGIETRGRSRRLTVNYRTSREILDWSLRVAYGQSVDDLDGGKDTLAGARSEFGGPEPETRDFRTTRAEQTALAQKLKSWSDSDIDWSQMAVVARENADVAELTEFLTKQGIPVATVGGTTDENAIGDKVRVMTMHRAKGLEYRAVAIPRASSAKLPPRWVSQLDDEARDMAMARERGLLYVSGSRARERLYVSWTGRPSELLNQPS